MLDVDNLSMLDAGLEYGELQNAAGTLVQHEFACVEGSRQLILTHPCLQCSLHRRQVDLHLAEQPRHGVVLFAQDAEQQMLRAYRPTGKARGLFAAEGEYLRYLG